MKEIICLLPLLPIRKEPDHRSEMTSQLLFGEKALIINQAKDWIEIKTSFDQYTGWVEIKSTEIFEQPPIKNEWRINPFPLISIIKEDLEIYIPAGAEIPNPDNAGCFQINHTTFKLDLVKFNNNNVQISDLTETALKFRNTPYLWGGRSIMGIDCSGLVQIMYKIVGITLPRDAKDQSETGTTINSVDDTKPGDLFFFNNEEDKIVHVGILIEPNKIIHSSGFVRIDTIDDKGIFNQTIGKYTHNLKLIKRHSRLSFENI